MILRAIRLAFTASGLPAGLQINSASGTISGTLATGSDGPHAVTVTVNDGQGNSPEVSFSWQVNVPGAATTVEVRVASSADDAEERSSGSISLSSSDLELTTDGSDNQWIGMRFAGLSIPA